MNKLSPLIDLVARVALCLVFLGSAFNKVTNFAGTSEYMASNGMPATDVLLVGAIAFLVLGGLSVVLGFRARVGALLLLAFLVPATLIFHLEPDDPDQMIQVMKNLAIGGGLLFVLAHGAGPISVDARRSGGE